jgi:hypothetical protein
MGRAYDATRSYETLLVILSVATLVAAGLMLLIPRYHSLAAPAASL